MERTPSPPYGLIRAGAQSWHWHDMFLCAWYLAAKPAEKHGAKHRRVNSREPEPRRKKRNLFGRGNQFFMSLQTLGNLAVKQTKGWAPVTTHVVCMSLGPRYLSATRLKLIAYFCTKHWVWVRKVPAQEGFLSLASSSLLAKLTMAEYGVLF